MSMYKSLLIAAMKSNQVDLTPTQAAYLQTLLPSCYSFQVEGIQGKRVRPTKKYDSDYINDFAFNERKREHKEEKINTSNSGKKIVEENQTPKKETPRSEIKP